MELSLDLERKGIGRGMGYAVGPYAHGVTERRLYREAEPEGLKF
jgi:hypothetical protein